MILKLGVKHQAMELYKVYINHDLGMTLIYFITRSTKVAYAFEWGKFRKILLNGGNANFPRGCLPLSQGS